MFSLLAELFARARHVPPEKWVKPADGLIESLRGWASPEVEAVWDAEILNRIGERERSKLLILVRLIATELRLSTQA